MKMIRFVGVAAVLVLPAIAARAETSLRAAQVGDTYEITLTRETAQQDSRGSSGSSHDRDVIIEKIIGRRADGLVLEYGRPNTATADEQAEEWQFPARIFKPFDDPPQLLNGTELESRLDSWLKTTGLPRTACGHWVFTWNAFRIECDPQSVIKIIESFDLEHPDLREGASYTEAGASGSGVLEKKVNGPNIAIFRVELPVDQDAVRHDRAESDVVVGEIMKKPVTLEAALNERSKEIVSGAISIVFEMGSDGNAFRRTKVTKLNIRKPDGQSEIKTLTKTLERRLISPHN